MSYLRPDVAAFDAILTVQLAASEGNAPMEGVKWLMQEVWRYEASEELAAAYFVMAAITRAVPHEDLKAVADRVRVALAQNGHKLPRVDGTSAA